MTAYSLPLSVKADSAGWPSRSFLLYAIVEVRLPGGEGSPDLTLSDGPGRALSAQPTAATGRPR